MISKSPSLFISVFRENPENFQIVELTEESLAVSNFDPAHPSIILAHGWNSNGRKEFRGFGAR